MCFYAEKAQLKGVYAPGVWSSKVRNISIAVFEEMASIGQSS